MKYVLTHVHKMYLQTPQPKAVMQRSETELQKVTRLAKAEIARLQAARNAEQEAARKMEMELDKKRLTTARRVYSGRGTAQLIWKLQHTGKPNR